MHMLFDFVFDRDLQKSLESDYQELQHCLDAGAWKAAHVLAGSIVEALLIESLLFANLTTGNSSDDFLKKSLAALIDDCVKSNLITRRTAELSSIVRGFRNLIHPGVVIRLGESAHEDGARIADALVRIVSRDLSEYRKSIYGYTAEQVVDKLERDPSISSVQSHFISGMNARERERLVIDIIPNLYISSIQDTSKHEFCERMVELYWDVIETSDQILRKKYADNFVRILKQESERVVMIHESHFFKSRDLGFLSPAEMELVSDHIFCQLDENIRNAYSTAMEGIGSHGELNEVQIRSLVFSYLRAIADEEQPTTRMRLQINFDSIIRELSDESRIHAESALDRRLSMARQSRDEQMMSIITRLKERLLIEDDLPF